MAEPLDKDQILTSEKQRWAGEVKSRATITWDEIVYDVGGYDLEVCFGIDDSKWQSKGRLTVPRYELDDTQPEWLRVRIRAVSSYGTPGIFNNAQKQLYGKLANPVSVTGFGATVTRGQLLFKWDKSTDLDVISYEIQQGTIWDAEGNNVIVEDYAGTSYPWTPPNSGNMNFLIKAKDSTGHFSTNASPLVYTVTNPSTPATLEQKVIDNIVELKWTASTQGTFPIDYYELLKGNEIESALLLGRKYSTFDLLSEAAGGTYKYWVRAVDIAGLASSAIGVYALVNQPPDYVLVSDLNIPLSGFTISNAIIEGAGTDIEDKPNDFSDYQIGTGCSRTGNAFTFVSRSFLDPGQWHFYRSYTGLSTNQNYEWVAEVYTATNMNLILTANNALVWDSASKAQNIRLEANKWITICIPLVTGENAAMNLHLGATGQTGVQSWVQEAGTIQFRNVKLLKKTGEAPQIVLPVNTTLTWENHFTNNPDTTLEPWSTPQDQIDDSYPVYAQPGTSTSYIEKIIDYGATIPYTKISMSVTRQTLSGTVTVTPEILISTDGISYTSAGNVYETVATFRYVKYRLVATTANGGLSTVSQVNVKLDVKQRRMSTVMNVVDTSSDGTQVNFSTLGITPVDVLSITADAPYTGDPYVDPIQAKVNFVDTAYPTSFKLVAWNKAGTRVAVNNVSVNIVYV